MSSTLARSSRTPGGAGALPTRQQLDELDALLQRMLDLPVHSVEEEPAPARPEPPPPQPRLYEPRPAPARPVAPRLPEPPPRSYPASYMVVETATPTEPSDEVDDAGLGPRLVEAGHEPVNEAMPQEPAGFDAGEDNPLHQAATQLDQLEASLPPPSDDWVPFRSAWQPSAQTWKPLAETWHQSRRDPVEPTAPPASPAPIPDPPFPVAPVGPVVMMRPAPLAEPTATLPPRPPHPPAEPPRPSLLLWPVIGFNQAFDLCLAPFGGPGRWLRGRAGRNLLGIVGLLCLCAAAALIVGDGIGWSW